ncbi:vegetatible incompatibility protein HET-E-1 [Striga asiatica]|uniref:Vegetatible incompatibility protein HET-E-1 n=1 Tax=Striga asiatica TaxID=4170 RepID=A0A5A7Q5W4_STRAF|nr:vegetatible incompatibility protein HET-E-1 [Striga asiatica]
MWEIKRAREEVPIEVGSRQDRGTDRLHVNLHLLILGVPDAQNMVKLEEGGGFLLWKWRCEEKRRRWRLPGLTGARPRSGRRGGDAVVYDCSLKIDARAREINGLTANHSRVWP